MTTTTSAPPRTPTSSLNRTEIIAVREIMVGADLVTRTTRFVFVALEDPTKQAVLAWRAGTGPIPERRARVVLLDIATGRAHDHVVSLDRRSVESRVAVDPVGGHVPLLGAETEGVDQLLALDERWVAALAARELVPAEVQVHSLSAGTLEEPYAGRRIVRAVGFASPLPDVEMYSHPVDGLTAYVDIVAREVLEVVDTGPEPIPQVSGAFVDPQGRTSGLETLRPIAIEQPEGPSFTIDGDVLTWANWRLQVGYDVREGLILRDIAVRDGDEMRPVVFRASLSEMVVPYGDPRPSRFWHNFFDFGEFQVARYANSLEHGCDCLGEIHYLDIDMADEDGHPTTVRNGICIHEEDFSVLWKHREQIPGRVPFSDMRRNRRLVVSSFLNAGNYDYGFYWYFYLDGTIECEVKLTGILFPSGYPDGAGTDGRPSFRTLVAPGLGAPHHQHLFAARLDMMVDGVPNNVDELDAVRLPMGPDNPHGNTFTQSATRIESEAGSGRLADESVGRVWRISSAERANWTGAPTSYVLVPGTGPTLMADPESPTGRRTAFAAKHLFVTAFHPDERYAGGDWVNQSTGADGVTAFIADDEPLEDADLVVWHTFGVTHFPRLEDWPVMPVDTAGFALKPLGFFDRNPTLGMPAPAASACHTDDHCGREGGSAVTE